MNLFFFILLFFLSTSLSAQTQTLSIETEAGCAGQEVLLKATGSNLQQIIAITLHIDIDPSSLSFLSLTNIDPQLQDIVYNYIPASNRLIIAWNSLLPASFDQKKLFDINCKVNNVPAQVNFTTGCEIADTSLQPVAVSFVNGTLVSALPVIESQPGDLTVLEGGNAFFQVTSGNSDSYQWEASHDSGNQWSFVQEDGQYSGSNSNRLSISNVPVLLNNTRYRCILGNNDCITVTASAALQVDSVTSVGNPDQKMNFSITNRPNPFAASTSIEYYLPGDGNVHIRIFSMLGTQIADLKNTTGTRGLHKITFGSSQLPSGIYLCQIEFLTENKRFLLSKKMIKN